jgi:hypothetical protein
MSKITYRFSWAAQFRYIPGPHRIWAVGDEFGFHLRRMGGLPAALTHLTGLAQQPIKRRLRAQVNAFIEQGGPHLSRCDVDEPIAVQHIEDRLLLSGI